MFVMLNIKLCAEIDWLYNIEYSIVLNLGAFILINVSIYSAFGVVYTFFALIFFILDYISYKRVSREWIIALVLFILAGIVVFA
jgi:NADH:ubiquinone oxidoreductase subunit 2 (subunit N)